MLIGIDHGNYAIKTPGTEFVAGLKEHSVKPPIFDEVLSYNGLYYTLSGKRISYMRDKTRDIFKLVNVLGVTPEDITDAFQSKWKDFEDCVQYTIANFWTV